MHDISLILKLFNVNDIIKPTLKNLGIVYDINGTLLNKEYLERLEYDNILLASGYEYYPTCNICNSTSLITLLLCNTCKSNELEKHDMLIHYDCNYIAPSYEFIIKEGVYKCPKCTKSFNKVGIDYGRIGDAFICLKCKSITQYPLLRIRCNNGHLLNPYDLSIIKFKCYKLSNDAKRYIKAYDSLLDISNKLKINNIDVSILPRIKGISGVEHTIALYIKNADNIIIIDYVIGISTPLEWLSVTIKIMDIPHTLAIAITDTPVDDNILSLLEKYNIRLITIDNKDIVDILITEVRSIVCRI